MKADSSNEPEYAANGAQETGVAIRVLRTKKTRADRDTRGPPERWAMMGLISGIASEVRHDARLYQHATIIRPAR
jgi:hypothetical protein